MGNSKNKRKKLRVVHGDALQLISQNCESNSIDLVACDPPFGIACLLVRVDIFALFFDWTSIRIYGEK